MITFSSIPSDPICCLLMCRQREEVCRTVSLCTGMQSSTMAGLLATQFLGGSGQAVPPACSVVAMAIMGLSLASFWGSGFRIRDLPSLLSPQTGSAVQAWWRNNRKHIWGLNQAKCNVHRRGGHMLQLILSVMVQNQITRKSRLKI